MRIVMTLAVLALAGCRLEAAVTPGPAPPMAAPAGGGGGLVLEGCYERLERAIAQLPDRAAEELLASQARLLDELALGASETARWRALQDFEVLVWRLERRAQLGRDDAERLVALAACLR